MQSEKILVTGGTGFIGKAIVRRLVKNGFDVSVFDNNFRGSDEDLYDIKDNIEIIHGDVTDINQVNLAVKGKDIVIHLACVNGTENFYKKPNTVLDVGVIGVYNIIRSCETNGVKKFFFASSSEVYHLPDTIPTPEDVTMVIPDIHNPRYTYALVKMLGESYTLHSKIPHTVIFRPHNVYGPGMGTKHVVPQLLKKFRDANVDEPITIQGDGTETRAFCYIDDFVEGFMCMLEHSETKNVYNIGTDTESKIKEVVDIFQEYFMTDHKIESSDVALGATSRRCPDINKLRDLGYEPKVSLHDGMFRSINWYDAHFYELDFDGN